MTIESLELPRTPGTCSTKTSPQTTEKNKNLLHQLQDKAQRYPYEHISNLESEHFWFIVRNERICKLIQSTLPNYKTARFLEIGSGTGNVLGFLSENGFQNLTGYEVEESGLEISRLRFPKINFEFNNLLDPRTKEAKFDAIGLFDCIEHFLDEQEPLENTKRMLKPGGKIYVTVPAHNFLWSTIDELFGHYRRYNKKDLHTVLTKSGFTNIEHVYFMAPLVPLAIIHRKLKKYPDPKYMTEEEISSLLNRETSKPHDLINATMLYLARLEHQIMDRMDLNFGGSILAVATFPG